MGALKLKKVTVWAFVDGDDYIVVDHRMRRRMRIKQTDTRKPSVLARAQAEWRWQWRDCSIRLAARLKTTAATGALLLTDPWERKLDTLRVSLNKRMMDLARYRDQTVRRQHEPYPTADWAEAIERLWHQANNKFARHRRSGWWRWCQSVANNSNKRKGGPYGRTSSKEARDDQGERSSEDARAAGIQMCFDW